MTSLLAADVGGTKTLLQRLEWRAQAWVTVLERRYESSLFPTFESLLREFGAADCDAACFAVAGPVHHQVARVTNLEWVIDAPKIAEELGIGRIIMVNDFHAIAAGVPHLAPDDLSTVYDAPRDRSAPIGILGAGTGLGVAVVVPRGQEWIVVSSEGGHADFAPNDEVQDGLLRHLRIRYGHVSWERVLSGPGLVNILTYLRDSRADLAVHDFSREMDEDDLPARIAEEDAKGNPLARATFDLFLDVYGAEAGNMALRSLARGGIFLAGGIAAKNAGRVAAGPFLDAYLKKGRLSDVVRSCPVDIIMNTRVGLIGAAHLAASASKG